MTGKSSDEKPDASGDKPKRKRTLDPGNMPPGTQHYLAKLRELLKGKVSADEWDAAVKQARGHAGGKTKGKKAASEGEQTGVMVAYMLKPEEAAALAECMPGIDTTELHITLAYLGDSKTLPDDVADRAGHALATLAYMAGPVNVESTGVDRFEAEDTRGDQDVVYATVDEAGDNMVNGISVWPFDLCGLREQVAKALANVGLSPRSDYGEYVPHITLAYVDPDSKTDVTLPDLDMAIDTLSLVVAGNRTDYPLTGGAYPVGLFMNEPKEPVQIIDLCESGEPWRLFNAQAFAEPPEWMPVLPIPGNYQHPGYGTIEITPDRNANFVRNFNSGVYQKEVAVDAEHETKLSGALGWINRLRQNNDGSVDGRVEWTDRGRTLIEGNAYKYVSPEWYVSWTDPTTGDEHEDVLIGAALTTRPFFKDKALRPLVASERGIASADRPIGGRCGTTGKLEMWTASEAQMSGTPKANEDEAKTGTQNPPANNSESYAEMQAALTAANARIAASEKALETAQTQSQVLSETVKAITSERRREKFTAMATGRGGERDGRQWYGETANHVSHLEALAEAFGEDSDVFKNYVKQQDGIAEAMKDSALFAEMGRAPSADGVVSDASVEDEIVRRAGELATKEGITVPVAQDRLLMSDRDLAARYANEKRQRMNGRS